MAVLIGFLSLIASIASVLDSFSSTSTLKGFFIENVNLLYFVVIIAISLTIIISIFLFLLKRNIGRYSLQRQITNAFIEAIENSSLNSKLKVTMDD